MNRKGRVENLTEMGNGRPMEYASEDAFYRAWNKAIDENIVENDYARLPSKTNVAKWMEIDLKTLYNYLNLYFPNQKEIFHTKVADVLAEGAALGKYNTTMVIFCLKNWCDWTDKQEQKVDMSASVQMTVEDYFDQIDDGWN